MVILVGDDDALPTVDGDTGWTVELAGTGARGTESPHERAVLTIDLYTIVGSVGDYDVTPLVARHTPRPADVVGDVPVVADDLHHPVRLVVPNRHGEAVIRYRTGSHDRSRRGPYGERATAQLRRVAAVDRATLPDRAGIGRHDGT